MVEMNKKTSSDYIVGNIAALSMYISLLFLIFQVLVWIPVAIVAIVLVEKNIIPKPHEGLATFTTFVLAESILITGIIIHIKRKYVPFELIDRREQGQLKPFDERYLEWMLNITAGAGVIWIILLGWSIDSIRIFFIVIQGFGVLFFTIFFIVRLLLTKSFAFRTLLSVLLSAVAIWIAIMA